MNPNDFTIQGTWRTTAEGQEYEAVARTNTAASRIVSRATGSASYNNLDALQTLLGVNGRATLEASVTEACRQMALAVLG